MQNYLLLSDEKAKNTGSSGSTSGSNGNPAAGIIGEGTYGVVLKAQHRETGQLVAIKKFKESDADEATKKTSLREVRLLKQLRHDNIVSLLEVFRRKGKLYLVFDYVDQTILELIERQHPNGLPPDEVKKYTYQLLRGVEYCHQHGVIHRDIKPENVLTSKTGSLKICDFGFARVANTPGARLTDYVATRWYRAPELLVGDTQYNKAVDIWAIGCIFAEISTGMPLFPGESDLDQTAHITRCFGRLIPRHVQVFRKNDLFRGVQMPEPAGGLSLETLERRFPRADPQWLALLKACLRLDPDQRASCQALMDMPYFTDGGWRDRYEAHLAQVFEAEQRKLQPIRRSTQMQADALKAQQDTTTTTTAGSSKNTPPPTASTGKSSGGGGAGASTSAVPPIGKTRTPSPATLASTGANPLPTNSSSQHQHHQHTSSSGSGSGGAAAASQPHSKAEQSSTAYQREQADRLAAMQQQQHNQSRHYPSPTQQQADFAGHGVGGSSSSHLPGSHAAAAAAPAPSSQQQQHNYQSVTMSNSHHNSGPGGGGSFHAGLPPPHHRSSGATSPASFGSSGVFGGTDSHRQTPTQHGPGSLLPDIRGAQSSFHGHSSGGGAGGSLLPAIGRGSPAPSGGGGGGGLSSSTLKNNTTSSQHHHHGAVGNNNNNNNNSSYVTSTLGGRLSGQDGSLLHLNNSNNTAGPSSHHGGGYTFTSSLAGGGGPTSTAQKKLGGSGVGATTTTHYGLYGHSSSSNNRSQLPSLGVTGSSATSIFANSPLHISGQGNTTSSSGGGGGGAPSSHLHHQQQQPSPYAMPVGGIGSTGAGNLGGGGVGSHSSSSGLGLTYKKKNTSKKVNSVSSTGLPSYLPPSGGGGSGGSGHHHHHHGVGGGGGGSGSMSGPNSLYAAPAQPSFGVTGVAAGRGGYLGGGGMPTSSEGRKRHG